MQRCPSKSTPEQVLKTASPGIPARLRISLCTLLAAAACLSPVTAAAPLASLAPFWSIASSAIADPALAGRWSGEIKTPGPALRVQIDIKKAADGSFSGTIDIPQQGAKDLALEKISQDTKKVTFKISGIGGDPTFNGELNDDGSKITGSFLQAGMNMPFTLDRATPPAETAKDALAGWDDHVNKVLADWYAPGASMVIVKDGETLLAKGFGLRDREKNLPVTERTLFAIGSSTKAFTTFAIGLLVDEGKLDWDKPVRTWIPEFKLKDHVATERMTPRDLVTHRSGLPRHDMLWYNTTYTRSDMVNRLQYLDFSKDFRTTWQYNNLMYLTAGYLTERVTGAMWESTINSRIFMPLGMTHSNFSVVDAQKTDDYAIPYDEFEKNIRRRDFRDISNVGPAGSIMSNAEDMAAWVKVHLGNGNGVGPTAGKPYIKKSTLNDMHTSHMSMPGGYNAETETLSVGYGLGWFVDVYRGVRRVHHGGNIDGFSCLVTLIPEKNLGFVVMVNQNGSAVPGLLVRHATDRLLGLPARDWSAEALVKRDAGDAMDSESEKNKELARVQGTTPSHKIADFTGDYEHPGYGVISIAARDNDAAKPLAVTINGFTLPLEHWHYDVFAMTKVEKLESFNGMKIQFTTGLDGSIESLRLPIEPSVEPLTFTRKADAKYTDPAFLQRFTGEFDLGPQTVKFEISGNTLTATLPGQPVYTLVPKRDNNFDLKGLSGFSVKFTLDDKNTASEAVFIQPNGVFAAKRKQPKP